VEYLHGLQGRASASGFSQTDWAFVCLARTLKRGFSLPMSTRVQFLLAALAALALSAAGAEPGAVARNDSLDPAFGLVRAAVE
jgi:hypothetical protein